jgi:hypothetical protein
VLARWATARQVERDAELTEFKAREATGAARRKRENAARVMARAGNPDALLRDLRDGGSYPTPPDDRPAARSLR